MAGDKDLEVMSDHAINQDPVHADATDDIKSQSQDKQAIAPITVHSEELKPANNDPVDGQDKQESHMAPSSASDEIGRK